MKTILGGFASLSFIYAFIKSILEIVFYVSVITLSYKGIRALNIYLDKYQSK